jgi:hypothetical protein
MGKQVSTGQDKDPKSWFQYYENKVINDNRFINASAEEQQRYLGNAFDKYGSFMYNGAKTPEEREAVRNEYIATTFQKINTPDQPEIEPWTPPMYSKEKGFEFPEPEKERADYVQVPPVYIDEPDVTDPEKEEAPKPQPINQNVKNVLDNVERIYEEKGWPSPNKKIQMYEDRVRELQQQIINGDVAEDQYEARANAILNDIGLGRDGDKIYVFPNEVELYREEVDKAYRQHLNERKEAETDGFFKDVLDALEVGSRRVMTSPTRILAITEKLSNGMLNLIDQKDRFGASYWQDRAKIEGEIMETMSQNNMRYTEGITDLVKSGNMRGAVGQTVMQVAENAPLMAMLVMGNAAGATNATLGFMGADKAADEYMRNEQDPDMTELVKIVNAVGKGMSEIVFENMGTMTIIKGVRKAVAEAGEATVRDQLIKAYTPWMQRQLAVLMKGNSAAMREGAEEMMTEFTDNLLDWANDKDVDVGANVVDAGIVGAVFGSVLASPEIYADLKGGKSEYIKSIADVIPDELDFERKMRIAELMIESDQIKAFAGNEGMSEAEKIRIKEIQEEVNSLLGIVPEEEETEMAEGFTLAPEYVEAVRQERAYFEDLKIKEAQERLNLPDTPDLNIDDATDETLDMIDRGEPVINDRLKEAASQLYGEYKRLAAMKEADKRDYTQEQIEDMMEVLETEITLLNNRINEQAEKGEFTVKEVELTDEVTVSEITEEREGEDIEGEPGPVEKPTEEPTEEPAEEPAAEPEAEPDITPFMDQAQLTERIEVADRAIMAINKMEKEGRTGLVKDEEDNFASMKSEGLFGIDRNKIETPEDYARLRQEAMDLKAKAETALEERKAMPPVEEGMIRYGGRDYASEEELAQELAKYPTEKLPQPDLDLRVYKAMERAREIQAQPPAEEPPKRFEKPEEIRTKKLGDINQELTSREAEAKAIIDPLEVQIEALQKQLDTQFKGRLTLEKKKERAEARNELTRARAKIDQAVDEWETEVGEYAEQVRPYIEQAIRDLVPTITDENLETALNTVWEKMTQEKITPEDAGKTIDDIVTEILAEEPVEEPAPAIPDEKTRMAKHNILLSRVRSYNEMPKNQTKKRASLYNLIGRAVADLGYTIGMKGADLVVTDPEGKPIRSISVKVPKEEIEAHPALADYDNPDFVSFVNTIMESPEFLTGYDVNLSNKEIPSAVKNIKAGNKTVAANKLLDALEESFEEGIISLKATRNTPAAEVPIKEFMDLLTDEALRKFTEQYGELSPDNVNEAVNMGLMTTEERDQYIKNFEDEIEAQQRAEAGIEPEPGEERPVDIEGEVPVEGEAEVNVEDELKAMVDLLDDPDLDFGGGMEMAAGGTGSVDAATKMLQTATKLIGKMADAKVYDFYQMIRKLIPAVERRRLDAMLPYLKQGYMAYWATAPENVKAQMNIVVVGSFDTSDIDMIIEMDKPAEEVEVVPPPQHEEFNKELGDIIRGYEAIGKTIAATRLQKMYDKPPENWKDWIKHEQDQLRYITTDYKLELGQGQEQPEGLTPEEAFTWDIKNHLLTGKPLENWNDVKRLAKKHGIERKDALRDQYELAIVEVARSMAQDQSIGREDRWAQIYNLYQTAPGIPQTARTTEVKEKQQYSTPVPISFLMGEYVNASKVGTILDPSAGNGSLLIGAKKEGVRANDIDNRRHRNLVAQGYRVFKEDSTHGLANVLDVPYVDALVINPPFGGPKESYNGYPLSGEYVPVAYALESLRPDGKAAIIVGGHIDFKDNGQMKGKDLYFFNWLNKYFNVEDVIQVPGEMYKKMGAQYPIKIILVNGRKAAPEGAAPLYSESFKPVEGWSDLKYRIYSKINKPHEKTVSQSKVDAERGDDSFVVGDDTGGYRNQSPHRTDTLDPGEDTPPTPTGTIRPEDQPDRVDVGDDTGGQPRGPVRGYNEPPSIPKPEGVPVPESRRKTPRGFGTIQPGRSKEDLPVRDIGKPTERTKRELDFNERTGDEVTPYVPLSQLGNGNYVIPASIAVEVEDALMQLKDEVGDVDQYVMEKLGYNSLEEMSEAFFAEQIDGIGQAIFNIEGGNAMIIGHQTGTGKGRMAAALIRYAQKNGKMPVFITKSADLFSDMARDMIDIGNPKFKPFIMNKQFASTGNKVRIFNPETGDVLHEVDPGKNDRIIGKGQKSGSGVLPQGTDVIMTTYSQFTTEGRDDAKRDFLMKVARDNDVVFIMDESHEASGASNTGQYFMNWIQATSGGSFLSATYAKRPDNLPLYAMKTVLQENNMTHEELIDAIKAGGPALQEIITLQLAEAGQFSKIGFKMDAEMNYLVLGDTDPSQRMYNPELGEEMVRKFDAATSMLQDIIDFQRDHVNPVLQGMNEEVKRQGSMVEERRGTSQAGISNTSYFSRVWNIIDQLLLATKVKESLPLIIEDLKAGKKPVVALKSTMEAMFDHMVDDGFLVKGQTIPLDFSYVFKRGMGTVMKYTEKDAQGNPTYLQLGPENLTPEGRDAYYTMMEKINKLTTDIPVSPIDVLRKGITQAGFEVVEITGRNTMFDMNEAMTEGKYVNNDRGDKIKAIRKFNNNPGVAAIINKAGSTGTSMHSSPKFEDQNQRSMYILQNDLDINVVVQLLGRVYRAKQLNKPIYNILTSTLPAELRMFMMNARKLKSLDANVSGNQKQSKTLIDVPDFLNKYGDRVVYEYLKENPYINQLIGDPLRMGSEELEENLDLTNAAHKVTGRVQILPSYMQEEFNRDVIERYEAQIEYLNSTGTNDLMVTSENLEAETKETEVAIHGNGGWSSFGDDTNLHTVDANVTRKPFTKQGLDEVLDEVPENHVEQLRSQMEAGIEAKMNEDLARVQETYEMHRQALKKRVAEKTGLTEEEKKREYDIEVENIDGRERFQLQGIRDNAQNNKARFNSYLDFFYPGRGLEIPFTDDEQFDGFRLSKGAFISFDVNMNKPNPWIPSNFMLKFATTDSRRMIRIPVSKSNHLDAIRGNSNHLSEMQSRDIVENWDSHRKGRNREIRYIATDNVLQGMSQFKKGRLIQFTRNDGTIDKGILMPENWKKPTDKIARLPIHKAIGIIKALQPNSFVEDFSGDIMIKKLDYGSPQKYELRVPATTKRGSKYYTNEQLREIVDYGQFEQHGDRMIATFNESGLEDLVNILNERFKIMLEVDGKAVAQAYDQTDSYDTMSRYGTEGRRKAKIRRGLTNPHNETLGAREKRTGTRIPPAPITGATPKKMWDIQLDLSDAVGFKVRYAKRPSKRGKAIGSYQPGSGRVLIKWRGDLNTTAHEIGHAMDDAFGLLGPEAAGIWGELREELSQLWEFGSDPPRGHDNPDQYRMGEGMAEFIRAWMVNPTETKNRFATTYAWVKERISQDPKTWEGLLEFSKDIREWWGAPASEQILSRIALGATRETPKFVFQRENEEGQFQMTTFDRWARKYVNFFRPLEMAYRWGMEQQGIDPQDPTQLSPSQNFEILARLHLGLDVKMRNAMEKGLVDFQGNRIIDEETHQPLSFHLLFSQIPNHTWKDIEQNKAEAIKFGMAARIVEIPWKVQARQIRQDLSTNLDVLPPEEILKLHPHIMEVFSDKINKIYEKMNKGELDPKDVFLPAERYDFTDMVIAGIAQEGMRDYDIAVAAVKELEAMKQTDPERYKWIKEFNRIYQTIGENIMTYARDSGLISEKGYQQIVNENMHYMAMKRLFAMSPKEIAEGKASEGLAVTSLSAPNRSGLVKVVIHPIKGSMREIRDPVEALIEAYHKVVQNGDLNYVISSFARAFTPSREPYTGQPIKVGEVAWVSKSPEQNSIPFFVKGAQRYLIIPDPELHKLMVNLIPESGGAGSNVVKALSFLPQLLRRSVVGAPVFALRNIVRDFQHFMVIGQGLRYWRPFGRNLDIGGNKFLKEEFEISGAGQFGYLVSSKRGYNDLMKMSMYKVSRDPKKILYAPNLAGKRAYEKIFGTMMKGERVTRMVQFKAAIREGMQKHGLTQQEAIMRAAFISRDLMDFMVGGTQVKEWNRIIIFLNPAIRGLDKIARNIKDPQTRKSTLAKMGVVLAIPGILNSLMIALLADDDQKEEYLNAPAYQRDMYFRIPIGDRWLFIPRPFELATITAISQRLTDRILLGDENAFTPDFFKSIAHLISPVDVAGLFGGYGGVVAALFNYDFFRQKNIIPPGDVGLTVASRNTEYASQFSQLAQEASDIFTKGERNYLIDARKLDAFILGQGSYYGSFFLKATELMIPGPGQEKFKFDFTSTGFVKQANVYAEPNTQYMLRLFKKYPWLREEAEYGQFSQLMYHYFTPEVQREAAKRREVATALRQYSSARREAWKDIDFDNESYARKQIEQARRGRY